MDGQIQLRTFKLDDVEKLGIQEFIACSALSADLATAVNPVAFSFGLLEDMQAEVRAALPDMAGKTAFILGSHALKLLISLAPLEKRFEPSFKYEYVTKGFFGTLMGSPVFTDAYEYPLSHCPNLRTDTVLAVGLSTEGGILKVVSRRVE